MTESEAATVRAELHRFRDERLQRDREMDAQHRQAIRWYIGTAVPLVILVLGWGIYVNGAVNEALNAIKRIDATQQARSDHSARLAVLESGLVRIERQLDLIANYVRRESKRRDAE